MSDSYICPKPQPSVDLFYRGISHQAVKPNRYPYIYEARPHNTLYGPYRSSKPFPYTNRPRETYPVCKGYIPYTNLLDYCALQKGQVHVGWWSCDGEVY